MPEMNLKRKIRIAPEKRKSKGKEITHNVPIRIRVSYNGKRIDLFSGYRIDIKDWDYDNSKVIDGRKNKQGQTSDEVNIALANYENDINRYFFESAAKKELPTNEDLKEAFQKTREKYNPELKKKETKPKPSKNKKLTLFDVFDEYTSYTGKINNWTEDTYSKFRTIKSHLFNFNEKLSFDDLTQEGLSDLLAYFMNDLQFRNETTKRYIEFVYMFLRYAHSRKHTTIDDFLTFKPKLKRVKKNVIFLTEEELNQIKKAVIPESKQYLERVKDVLLFLCYSGLRHSDVYNLKRSNIVNDKIYITTEKTYDSLVIELNEMTKSIIKKYEHIPFRNDKALPVISNQKTNDYLKELGEIVGLNDPVTETFFIGNKRYSNTKPKYEYMSSHIGRRTFICLCIAKGIPIQVIMKWTGHTDYKSMVPYIEVAEKTKEVEMEKLNF